MQLKTISFNYLPERDIWELNENIFIQLSNGSDICIPKGMLTDGRSTPKLLRGILPQFSKHILAYLVHDYLYISNRYTQKFSDNEMMYWQKKLGMKTIEAYQTDDGRIFGSLTEAKAHEVCNEIMSEIEAFMQSDACNYKRKQQQTMIKSSIISWHFWKADKGINQ